MRMCVDGNDWQEEVSTKRSNSRSGATLSGFWSKEQDFISFKITDNATGKLAFQKHSGLQSAKYFLVYPKNDVL